MLVLTGSTRVRIGQGSRRLDNVIIFPQEKNKYRVKIPSPEKLEHKPVEKIRGWAIFFAEVRRAQGVWSPRRPR